MHMKCIKIKEILILQICIKPTRNYHIIKEFIYYNIIIHDSSHNSAGMLRKGFEKVSKPDLTPGTRHPAVITNIQNNKKRLFIGRKPNAYILGLIINENEKILNEIWYYATT